MLIESSSNPQFKRWKSLLNSQGLKKTEQALVMGRKTVPELSQFSAPAAIEVICSEDQVELAHELQLDAPVRPLKKNLFQQIDVLGSQFPIACIAAPQIPQFNLSSPLEGLHLYLAMSDPQNLGATIRSAVAFKADQIILLSESAHPMLPRAIRASSGTALSAPISYGPSLRDCARFQEQNDLSFIGLDMQGQNIHHYSWPKNSRLLIGEEGAGLPDFVAKENKISIPIDQSVESLNAMAATSIALFCYNHKQMT